MRTSNNALQPTHNSLRSLCAAERGRSAAWWRRLVRFAESIGRLTAEQRLHFYEVLAHNLTVTVRSIWSDSGIGDGEKIERMKWINEVLHRVTAKVYALRLKTHEWTETDFEDMLLGYSYKIVTGDEMGEPSLRRTK